MSASRIFNVGLPCLAKASGVLVSLSLFTATCSSRAWAQGASGTVGADSTPQNAKEPRCGDYVNSGFSLEQLESACETAISKLERQRAELLRDKLDTPDRLGGIDAVMCFFKDQRRKLLISLGRYAGPPVCPGHEWGRHGPDRRSSGNEAPPSDTSSPNFAGSISEYPMFDSEAPYTAISDETTTITLPTSVSTPGTSCSGTYTKPFQISLFGGIGAEGYGLGDVDLVQNGVQIQVLCLNGIAQPPSIYAWYEDYYQGQVGGATFLDGAGKDPPLLLIALGQTLTVRVHVDGPQHATVYFTVGTTGVHYSVSTHGVINQTNVGSVAEKTSNLGFVNPTSDGSSGACPVMTTQWSGVVGQDPDAGGSTVSVPPKTGINDVLTEPNYCDYYTLPTAWLCNQIVEEAVPWDANGNCAVGSTSGNDGVVITITNDLATCNAATGMVEAGARPLVQHLWQPEVANYLTAGMLGN